MGAIRSKTCSRGHLFDAKGKNGRQRCLTCEGKWRDEARARAKAKKIFTRVNKGSK